MGEMTHPGPMPPHQQRQKVQQSQQLHFDHFQDSLRFQEARSSTVHHAEYQHVPRAYLNNASQFYTLVVLHNISRPLCSIIWPKNRTTTPNQSMGLLWQGLQAQPHRRQQKLRAQVWSHLCNYRHLHRCGIHGKAESPDTDA